MIVVDSYTSPANVEDQNTCKTVRIQHKIIADSPKQLTDVQISYIDKNETNAGNKQTLHEHELHEPKKEPRLGASTG